MNAEVESVVEALVWVSVTAPVVYPNGDRAQYLDHTFRCRYLSGTAAVGDDESTEVGWFPVDALPDLPAHLAGRIHTALLPPQQAPFTPWPATR